FCRERDGMLLFQLGLVIAQVPTAARVLQQAVVRQCQEFADSQAASLEDERHAPERGRQSVEAAVELRQHILRNVARLWLGQLRQLFVKEQALPAEVSPAFAGAGLDEGV